MKELNNDIVKYMVRREWSKDRRIERKKELFRLAKQSKSETDIAHKIGGMLIYNQVIEQYLADIIDMSIHYIKADLWPVTIDLQIDADKATFGKTIEYFRQYATIEPNREVLLEDLKKYNIKRNMVVHDLFDIRDLHRLSAELDEYADLAEQILKMLSDYEEEVCKNFRELEMRVDFRSML